MRWHEVQELDERIEFIHYVYELTFINNTKNNRRLRDVFERNFQADGFFQRERNLCHPYT
jgi:hypothetical protein